MLDSEWPAQLSTSEQLTDDAEHVHVDADAEKARRELERWCAEADDASRIGSLPLEAVAIAIIIGASFLNALYFLWT